MARSNSYDFTKEDVEEIMREMDFIAKKELLGNGGSIIWNHILYGKINHH